MYRVNGIVAEAIQELRYRSLINVHHVNHIARMYATYMSTHVRRMLRSVDTIGTLVSRWPTAFYSQVILKIVFQAEHAAAITARKS